jgi:protein-export membrane protein SecD
VLDGQVITAPAVNTSVSPETGITGGSAQITMGRSETDQQEAQDLALVLRYGSLPVPFEISSVTKVSGTLGADSLRSGIIAGLVGLFLVAAFLIVVYRALGLIAIVGLTVFGSLLITLFGLLGALQGLTLTLAGVTGIIVSIGITADSYIVYYERIKEKLREGMSVEDASEEGFGLAFRTILTADTVSLLGAVLLYFLAVGAVKGFALALGLATILDIIIARTFTRRAVQQMATTGLGDGGGFSIRGAAL